MFPSRFWSPRYFASRYWERPSGVVPPAPTVHAGGAGTDYRDWLRYFETSDETAVRVLSRLRDKQLALDEEDAELVALGVL